MDSQPQQELKAQFEEALQRMDRTAFVELMQVLSIASLCRGLATMTALQDESQNWQVDLAELEDRADMDAWIFGMGHGLYEVERLFVTPYKQGKLQWLLSADPWKAAAGAIQAALENAVGLHELNLVFQSSRFDELRNCFSDENAFWQKSVEVALRELPNICTDDLHVAFQVAFKLKKHEGVKDALFGWFVTAEEPTDVKSKDKVASIASSVVEDLGMAREELPVWLQDSLPSHIKPWPRAGGPVTEAGFAPISVSSSNLSSGGQTPMATKLGL